MLLSWLACTADSGPEPGILPPAVTVSEAVPTALIVAWDPPGGGDWWVEATPERTTAVARTAAGDGPRATLVGLEASTAYGIVAVAEVDGERITSPSVPVRIADVPALPSWTVTVLDPLRSEVAGGQVMTGFVAMDGGDSDVLVVDGDGDAVWWWRPGPGWQLTQVTVGAEGRSFVWGQYDATVATEAAEVAEVAFDGSEAAFLDVPRAHHVALEPVPGRYAWIELEVRDELRDGEPVNAGSDRIVESDADGRNAVEPFNAFDDLYADGFHYPCFHSVRSFDRYGVVDLTQWTHGNSLVYLPSQDVYFVFERWADTLVKVDRAAGQVLWQLGGPSSDFTLPGGEPTFVSATEPILWSHGHLTEVWEDGLLMYDNGNHYPRQRSRIARFAYDEQTRVIEEVLSIPAPGDAFTEVLGDARRLPSGNVLATWSGLGTIEEITPDGEVVWRFEAEPGYFVARSRYFASWEQP